MRKHDPELWKREVVYEAASKKELDDMEIMFIKAFGDLNLREGGGNGKMAQSTKDKISAATKGRPKSAETRARMSAAQMGHKNNLGHHHSEET